MMTGEVSRGVASCGAVLRCGAEPIFYFFDSTRLMQTFCFFLLSLLSFFFFFFRVFFVFNYLYQSCTSFVFCVWFLVFGFVVFVFCFLVLTSPFVRVDLTFHFMLVLFFDSCFYQMCTNFLLRLQLFNIHCCVVGGGAVLI